MNIFADEGVFKDTKDRLAQSLPSICDMLCRELNVDASVCQFSVIPVLVMPDQAQLSVELKVMPHVERTRERLMAIGEMLRDRLVDITGARTAIRFTILDPDKYIALK